MLIPNFIIGELDNQRSIRDRIAYNLNNKLLPRFLNVEIKREEKNAVYVNNLLDDIRQTEISSVVDAYQEFHDKYPEITAEEFAFNWYNLRVKATNQYYEQKFYEDITGERKGDDYTKNPYEYNFNSFMSNLESYDERLTREIAKFRVNHEEESRIVAKFSSYTPVKSDDYVKVTKIKTEYQFEVENDIYELFNEIKMTRHMPFANIREYYKVLKEFRPPDKWSYVKNDEEKDFQDKRDVLYLKVLNIENEPEENMIEPNENLYSSVAIYFESPFEEMQRKRLAEKVLQEKLDADELLKRRRTQREQRERKEQERVVRRKGEKARPVEQKVVEQRDDSELDRLKAYQEKLESERKIQERINESVRQELMQLQFSNKNKVYMVVESILNFGIDEAKLLKRILNAFPYRDLHPVGRQIQIKGLFYVPDFKFQKLLFSDLIMNNVIFSRLVASDERFLVAKEHGGIYLYYFGNRDGVATITCSLAEGIVESNNLKLIGRGFKRDSHYLRVLITKAENEYQANIFKNIFCRLLAIYQLEEAAVERRYAEYIDISSILNEAREVVVKKSKKSTRTGLMLKDINPDLFLPGYVKTCQPVVPTIIGPKLIDQKEDPPEVQKLRQEGRQVVVFPKNPEEGQQYYYTCNHDQRKYVGLKHNKLENNVRYPLIPCCYPIDQLTKLSSSTNLYYNGEYDLYDFRGDTKVGRSGSDKYIIKTNKFVPPKRFGILPYDVGLFFQTVDSVNKYLRQGISTNHSSIIDCIRVALNIKVDNSTIEERQKIIEYLIENEIDIYQEAYNYNRTTIVDYLEDPDNYLDPKLFIRLLEEYYGCYLYIFNQGPNNPDGILAAPYHLREYLASARDPDRPVVLIYEHYGSESAKFPLCELIVKDEGGNYTRQFESNFEVIQRIAQTFRDLYHNPVDDKRVLFTENAFYNEIISQGLDYYGKTRYLQFSFEGTDLCLLSEPLPPLNRPQYYEYRPVDNGVAKAFLASEEIKEYQYVGVNNAYVGIKFRKSDINFYIPIRESAVTKLDRTMSNTSSPTYLDILGIDYYNEFSRRARYIIEYSFYLFSIYYRNNQRTIDFNFIKEFAENSIVIIENFQYSKVDRTFSLKSGVLSEGKLVVPDTDCLKRVIYCIRLKLRDNENELRNYADYKYIQNYFVDIRDFNIIPDSNQIILYGQPALIQWISNKRQDYTLQHEIRETGITLYDKLVSYSSRSNLFFVIFYAKWSKKWRSLANKIYDPNVSTKPSGGETKRYQSLFEKFGKYVNFIKIDFDQNRGIFEQYEATIPSFYFMKIEDGILKVVDKISYVKKIYDVRILSTRLDKFLDEK